MFVTWLIAYWINQRLQRFVQSMAIHFDWVHSVQPLQNHLHPGVGECKENIINISQVHSRQTNTHSRLFLYSDVAAFNWNGINTYRMIDFHRHSAVFDQLPPRPSHNSPGRMKMKMENSLMVGDLLISRNSFSISWKTRPFCVCSSSRYKLFLCRLLPLPLNGVSEFQCDDKGTRMLDCHLK